MCLVLTLLRQSKTGLGMQPCQPRLERRFPWRKALRCSYAAGGDGYVVSCTPRTCLVSRLKVNIEPRATASACSF